MRAALTLVVTVFLLLSPPPVHSQNVAQKTVLVIESYHADYDWDISYMRGIRKGLNKIATITTFQMNTKRIPPAAFPAKADEAFAFFKHTRPDLVILADDNAAALLGKRLVQEGVPLVYLGITANPRRYGLHGVSHVLGVLEKPLIKRSIHIISDISAQFTEVLVLLDDSTTSREVVSDLLNNEKHFKLHGISGDVLLVSFFSEWKQRVLSAKKLGYDVLLLGTYHTLRNDDGSPVHESQAMAWLHANSPIPVFALWDFSIGRGKATGGFVLRGEDQGYAAAQMAIRLLNGTQDSAIPITTLPLLLLSRHEMQRWGLTATPSIRRRATWVD